MLGFWGRNLGTPHRVEERQVQAPSKPLKSVTKTMQISLTQTVKAAAGMQSDARINRAGAGINGK